MLVTYPSRLFVVLCVTAIPAFAQAQAASSDSESKAQIAQLERDWLKADGSGDTARLQQIIADDFVGTSFNGRFLNKEDIIPQGAGRPGGFAGATPGDGNVVLKDASNDASDLLTYHWLNGSAVSLSNYGDPTSGGGTAYAVCVYASPGGTPQLVFDAEIPAGGTCGGGPCWSASASGFDYADSAGSNDGITSVLLRAGSIQASKVTVSGHGVNLPMPTPADPNNLLYQAPLATVQVINSSGSCWQSVFPGPATQMTATLFKDKL